MGWKTVRATGWLTTPATALETGKKIRARKKLLPRSLLKNLQVE
jgi:hypothetical protein